MGDKIQVSLLKRYHIENNNYKKNEKLTLFDRLSSFIRAQKY